MNTRPDVTFAVNYVSRFLEKPKEDHMVCSTKGGREEIIG
jgi:hypothetical protein